MTEYYVGLDVSQRTTAICVIDQTGKQVCEGKSLTRPMDIQGWLQNRIALQDIAKVGLEAGTMSSWLHAGLCQYGLSVVCMETFQAHRFLAIYRNKTDQNDARGLAQLLRMGGEEFLKVVAIRSIAAQETRALLSMRNHLVSNRVSLENHISGILKPFGLVVPRGSVTMETFYEKVVTALAKAQDSGLKLREYVLPSLRLYREICRQIKPLTDKIEQIASQIEMVRRFQEIPGVGPITALSFYTAIDDPKRSKKSSDVAAYLGLTPQQYQSGESNIMRGISKKGDKATRRALVNAATVLLYSAKQWNSLRAWGVRLSKRIGFSKARVAVARKLAIIMHKIWLNNDIFRPKDVPVQQRKELRRYLEKSNSPAFEPETA